MKRVAEPPAGGRLIFLSALFLELSVVDGAIGFVVQGT
jgi:hypothetical protein